MATQTIGWTALPNGFDSAAGDAARISVFVSPRLAPDGDGTLEAFDFLNWAALFERGSIEFDLAFGRQTVRATIASTPRPELWSALFDAQTLVRPHVFDSTSRVVGTYPAARLHDLVQTTYQRVSSEPPLPGRVRAALHATFDDLQELFHPPEPAPTDLAVGAVTEADRAALAALVLGQPTRAAMAAHLDLLVDLAMREAADQADTETSTVAIIPDRSGAASAVTQFMAFHRQPRGTGTPTTIGVDQTDTRLDFHQRLTMLSEYPGLLRALGLVIDLHVDRADIPAATSSDPGLVRVVPHLTSTLSVLQHLPDITPATAYIFDPGRAFATAPRQAHSAETVSGLINLQLDGRYRVMQIDVDTAGLELLELLRKVMSDSVDVKAVRTLPALRSSGVTIVRQGAADALIAAMDTSRATLSAVDENTVLFDDDLIRGFRVDVGDPESGAWHSLHRRDATYRFGRIPQTLNISDEGWSQETVVQPATAASGPISTSLDTSAPNYISEYLFNWQGWSLTAPRPCAVLPDPSGTPESDEAQGLGMYVDVAPTKGSLPRLRFGRGYRLRLRTVDLAGNGLSLVEADEVSSALGSAAPILPPPGADTDFRFLRFDPVPPPTAVPRVQLVSPSTDVRVAGVDRIVLRSDFDRTPAELAEGRPDYLLDAERHFVPPATYQQLVEMHGLFDASIGTGANYDATHRLAGREERSLPQVHAGPDLPVDYLPDPLAAGAAFWNLPGMAPGTVGRVIGGQIQVSELAVSDDLLGEHQSVMLIDFGATWPDASSFRLRLAEGDLAPTWNAVDRVLTVFLPKGEKRITQVSTALTDTATLDLLGAWQWTRQRLRDQVAEGEMSEKIRVTREQQLEHLATLGWSAILTPPREITLVHAVQRPAGPEPVLSFTPVRVGNRTFAYTRGQIQAPHASTGTVELVASWSERTDTWTDTDLTANPADRPSEPMPTTRRATVFAGLLSLADSAESATSTTATVPAQNFDAGAGIVRYPGPALESVMATLDTFISEFQDALHALTQAAEPGEDFVHFFANSVAARLHQAAEFPTGPDYWAELSRVAEEVSGQAQGLSDSLGGDVLPGEPPPPIHLAWPYQELATAGEKLKTRADRSIAELRRFLGRHEFGDTKYRRVTYQAVLTSRFGEDFLAAGHTDADFTRVSNAVTIDIPSSMRPVAPEVRAIVPSFAWDRTSEGATRTIRRRAALRVQLARPWYTSGDGEMLGVIVLADPSKFPTFSNPIIKGITLLGSDPLWTSPRAPIMAAPANFPNAARKVSLTDPPNDPFALAMLGFEVAFDKAGHCFCDIEVVTPSYFPFVRLALVRYQPHSVDGLGMSSLVEADLAQVAPERTVSVVKASADTLSITVSGTTQTSPPDEFGRVGNRFDVTVQRRIPGTSDEVGWLPDTNTGFLVAANSNPPQSPLLWSGTVTRPATAVAGEYRLLIEELEPHTTVPGAPAATERVVFVETVPLR
ncbi:hypothetical protein [Nocardia asteroides]|uniref:hypothetical protein n=1 Tax=Nocardia asteroides TaxID=1824 RepID=UPI001E2AEEB6|nr:hypothetical protein [Nocardia asteroides]UGT55181.1 hypothetical protein LTT85_32145 [Nocardia asteroides]